MDIKGFKLDDLKKMADEGLKTVQEGARNFNAEEALHSIGESASAGVENIAKAVGDITGKEQVDEQPDSSHELISLLSYLAIADGSASQNEKEKITELASEIDEELGQESKAIIDACIEQVQSDSQEFGLLSSAKINAQRTIDGITLAPSEKKAICWNLFAVSSVDGLKADESDFIRFVCEKLGIEKATVEELSNYNDAISELGASKEQLKASNKSFGEIEPLINEITAREQAVIEAAQALVTDR